VRVARAESVRHQSVHYECTSCTLSTPPPFPHQSHDSVRLSLPRLPSHTHTHLHTLTHTYSHTRANTYEYTARTHVCRGLNRNKGLHCTMLPATARAKRRGCCLLPKLMYSRAMRCACVGETCVWVWVGVFEWGGCRLRRWVGGWVVSWVDIMCVCIYICICVYLYVQTLTHTILGNSWQRTVTHCNSI